MERDYSKEPIGLVRPSLQDGGGQTSTQGSSRKQIEGGQGKIYGGNKGQ
jgi:hypothetical protein